MIKPKRERHLQARLPGFPRSATLAALAALGAFSTPETHAHGGDESFIHVCVQQNNRMMRLVTSDNDCSGLQGGTWMPLHWRIESDGDWEGAGSGVLHPSNRDDAIGIGTENPGARLHVATDSTAGQSALRVAPRGVPGLTVDQSGVVLVGPDTGTSARLTVNALENEEVLRARANGITSLVVQSDGQVGVGTSLPGARLEVRARQDEAAIVVKRGTRTDLSVGGTGNVIIGEGAEGGQSTNDKLIVSQDGDGRGILVSLDNPSSNAAALAAINTGRGPSIFANILNATNSSPALFARHSGSGPAAEFDRGDVRVRNGDLIVTSGGRVRIGTPNSKFPGAELSVEGRVVAEAVIVTVDGFPDYVFDEGYELASLSEIEHYIEKHHHLPHMPSAAEVEGRGADLGELNKRLLITVEELTLYTIAQEKQIEQQRRALKRLERELAALTAAAPSTLAGQGE